MGQPTITVFGYFGKDKEMTEEAFCATWTAHCRELKRIDYDMEWTMQIDELIEIVERKCKQEFRALFRRQHGVDLADYRDPDE